MTQTQKSTITAISFLVETYSKALERAKRAENTSNIDTDPESNKRRAIKKPAKFNFSEEEEADGMTKLLHIYVVGCDDVRRQLWQMITS